MIELTTLEKLNLAVQANIGLFVDLASKEIVGKDVILLRGEYKGRLGCVKGITVRGWDGELCFLVHPYKLNNKGERTGELLTDRADARSYWRLQDIKMPL